MHPNPQVGNKGSTMNFFEIGQAWKYGLTTLIFTLALGCSRISSTTIKISSWGDMKENAILADMVNEFNKTHPDTPVELQRVSWGEYNTKLLTQVVAGIAPDIIFVSTYNIADLYPRGILEPLDDYVRADHYSVADIYPTLLDRFTIGDHLYGIPRDTSPICVVYYNKNAFDEVNLPYPTDDWTWNDLLVDAKALTKRDKKGNTKRWGYTEDSPMVEPWIYSAGARWVDNVKKPTRYTFNTPTFISAVQFRTDLVLKHKVMPAPSNMTAMGGIGASDLFMNGASAMFLSGIWKTPQFRDIKNFDWDVIMFPKGPTGQRAFKGGGSGYGILRSSKNKKAAWEFIKYITDKEGESKMAGTGLTQPALRSVAASSRFLDGQKPMNKKMLLKAEDHAIYEPLASNWRELREGLIDPTFDQVWIGRLTPQEAIEQLTEKMKSKPLMTEVQ
jgi:ABC-type glycerol-3-phosphate transport system substrate-binding protein